MAIPIIASYLDMIDVKFSNPLAVTQGDVLDLTWIISHYS